MVVDSVIILWSIIWTDQAERKTKKFLKIQTLVSKKMCKMSVQYKELPQK